MFIFAVAMECRTYISVILPLRLEWEPCYFITDELMPGPAQGGVAKVSPYDEENSPEQKSSVMEQICSTTHNSLIGKRVKINFSGKE